MKITKRQKLRKKQNEILSDLTRSMQESLECSEIQTKILKKKYNKKTKRKKEAKKMINGERPIRALVADSGNKIYDIARLELDKINGTIFNVSKAVNYDQVISAIISGKFDVILLDCNSFIEQDKCASVLIKASKKSKKNIPIIVYGPEDNYECDAMALEAGASYFLSKEDITAKRLEKTIRYCLCK